MTGRRNALVRGVPDSFPDAIVAATSRPFIDVVTATAQHTEYRRLLESAGVAVHLVDADPAQPDCPFIEDVAVIVGERAMITRPGAPARRGEVGPVAAALAEHLAVVAMQAPATLDGGDVLEVGGTLYVGRSARTNAAGFGALREFASGLRTFAVDVGGALHLKSVVNRLDDTSLLARAGHFPSGTFPGLRVVETAPGEDAAANVLALGGGGILVPDGYPATAGRLAAAGFEPVVAPVGEFAKADGGLTCLSLRW